MSSYAFYTSPQQLLADMVAFALFAILALSETIALIRVPRIAGQRGWRQWLAALPGLATLFFSAMVGIFIYAYAVLSPDPQYTPSAIPNCVALGNGATCPPPPLSGSALHAYELVQWADTRATYAVLGLFAIALFGFIALAIGRRRRALTAPVAS